MWFKIWSKDWNGYENQMTWKLFSQLPQSAFNELIQLLCDNERYMFTIPRLCSIYFHGLLLQNKIRFKQILCGQQR